MELSSEIAAKKHIRKILGGDLIDKEFVIMTSSDTMCQILTNRMTKYVSFCFVSVLIVSLSSFAYSQDEPVGMADPIVEAENADENKLEEIDEADVTYQDEGSDASAQDEQQDTATPLSEEVEDLKKAALELNRDLLILEEELLFPANSQIVVFLSLDIGKYFSLDSVKVLIDDKLVASHLYTKRQNTALSLGGIQRLYLGNLKSGEHEVTAFFVGVGPDNREYKRGATIIIDKDEDPKLLELKVRDSTANMQPEFEFEEWQL